MRTLHSDRLIALGLAALGMALGLAQRPGRASADTKISLHVDPVGFLADVASAWSPTEDLGHVQGGQYGGYLFPMGPFFAAGKLLGLAPWLVHRLWLGVLLALAAYGTVRLLDALLGRPRGAGHVVAGLLVLLNPYVVVFSARTTVTLLGYAALPWLLLAVHRGLRAPRSWWWPAAFALLVTCTGGGVNAAVTAWLLLGPLLLALYERFVGDVRGLFAFGWRTAVATGLASIWWVVPVLVQARHGVDFLRFTEQAGTIWSTTSLPESLRLMGYWLSYLGVGYGGELRPLFSGGGAMLFFTPVVLAGLLVPALALGGFAFTRRWRYGPFFLLLVLVGLVVMTAGFPEGTPLRRALNFTYNHVESVRFLRTSYKAGPLVALGIACLAGGAVARLGPRARWGAAAGCAALAVVAAWPLATGRALDTQLLNDGIPAAWEQAADHVDGTVGDDRRAVVLPGQLYAYYDWGGTVDHVLPALADRPVAVRYAVPYADLRSVDLLWTLDGLVQQRRALPGQLDPLLDLVSAGVVVAGADDDRSRSGAVPAATAAGVLDQLGQADARWGPVREEPRAAGTLGGARPLPRVRAWNRPSARPLVRVEPEVSTVVDGGAEGIAGLAAFGALPDRLAYAGDLDAAAIRRAGEVVVTDSNRRRVLAAARMTQNHGATLPADEPFPPDAAVLDLFPARGSDGQTVAVLDGVASLRAPYSPAFPQFPERRPFAAFDGDLATHWQADRALVPERHWLEVRFEAPRNVDSVELVPYSDRTGRVTEVEVAGRRFDVRPGWNRLRLGLRDVRSLRVRIARVVRPPSVKPNPGGLRELRIPGVRVSEALRPPVLAERALAGEDVSGTGLTYLFERTTGDDPFRRDPRRGSAGAGLVRDRVDGERGLERLFSPPAARSWSADGWATIAPDAPDSAIDRLAGVRGRFESSGRFEGRPAARASSAFDGGPRAWIGSFEPGRPAWIEWSLPRPAAIRELRLAPPRERVRRATMVRLGGMTAPVAADGTVTLPRPVSARRFRLEVVEARFPPGTPGAIRQRRAVGIAEIEGAGIPRARVPRSGALAARCGDLAGTIAPGADEPSGLDDPPAADDSSGLDDPSRADESSGAAPLSFRVAGDVADLDTGTPLRVRSCGAPVSLPAGRARLSLPPGVLAPYLVRLRSPAPDPAPVAASPGRVVDSGDAGRNARRGIVLDLDRPAWLVFGQAYGAGWRASCDGRDLGAPEPVDGYAMGWRVDADCRNAELWFAPDRLVRLGYWISVPVLLVLLLVLVLRRPPPARPGAPPDLPETEPVARMPARRAAVAALIAAVALAFVFAARAAPLIALGTFLILWRGIGVRALVAAAAGLLIVAVPLLTVAIPVRDPGGYNFEYAQDRIAVHWVTVAAVILLVLALARVLSGPLSTARPRRAGGRAGEPVGAASPPPAP